MTDDDQVTITAELMGPDDGPRWITGEYDTNPVRAFVTPELIAQLASDGGIAAEHLPRLAAIATAKVESGEARFGRREPDGRGMLVLTIGQSDWDEA